LLAWALKSICARSPVLRNLGRGCNIVGHESQGTEVLPELSAPAAMLIAQQAQSEARFKALEATIARLQAQLAAARKDSSTSSKPPSSDIVKPPKPDPPEGQERRRIGGQRVTPSTNAPPSRPNRSTVRRSTIASIFVPVAGSFAAHADDRAPSDPAGRRQGRAAGDPGASRSSRVVLSLSEAVRGAVAHRDRTGGLVGPRLTTVIAYSRESAMLRTPPSASSSATLWV